jgi:regulator of protease activity HflC (stomatin/prohibitin superfamily)
MVPDRQLDIMPIQPAEMEHERVLLNRDAEQLRAFYALSGPARKNYTELLAEAEAKRIRLLREAQAAGLLALRHAEAEGYRLIGEALAKLPNVDKVLEVARLHTVQRVADYLAQGNATKLLLSPDLANVFSLLDVGEHPGAKPRQQEARDLTAPRSDAAGKPA